MADDLSMDGFGDSLVFGSSNELSADFVAGLSQDDPKSFDKMQDNHEFQLDAGDISNPDDVPIIKNKRQNTGLKKQAKISDDYDDDERAQQASEIEEEIPKFKRRST